VAGLVAVVAAVLVHVHLAGATSYLVRDGDTLSELANRLGVSAQELAAANGITDPNLILAGKMLVVPSDGGSATEYLVRKGDTLSSISAAVGIPMADLAKANGLDDLNWVPAGRLLSVPPVGSTVPGVPNMVVNAAAGHYTVRSGDSLSDVAVTLGVPIGQLAAANGISDPNLIRIGQVITAPNVWECPVPDATFVNDYGYVEDGGGMHAGVDMFAPRGSPIYAPVGGTAVQYPNPSGGNGLELYGNDGNRYYFAHLDSYGDTGSVTAGTVVGYVGNTGDAETTSTHMHFEIHPGGGDSISPYPTLVSACR
jgi:murein DD-endopeptidase MepM/ murein hydrolase activator NlpD